MRCRPLPTVCFVWLLIVTSISSGCRDGEDEPTQPTADVELPNTLESTNALESTKATLAVDPDGTDATSIGEAPSFDQSMDADVESGSGSSKEPDPSMPPNTPSLGNEEPSVGAENLQPEAPTVSDHSLWIPTTRGPMLLGLNVRVDGKILSDHDERAVTQALNRFLQSRPESEGSDFEWEPLIDFVSDHPEIFGQMAMQARDQKQEITRRFDRDQDGRVDDREWRSFLFRDAKSAEPIRVVGTDAFRYINRLESAVFTALDRNGDRQIDRQEAKDAMASVLRQLDRNLDGCLDYAEVLGRGDSREPDPWESRVSKRHGDVAMDLSGFINWSDVSYTLGGMLKREAPLPGFHPVQMIDEESDGWISGREASSLRRLPSPVVLGIDFRSQGRSPSVSLEIRGSDAAKRLIRSTGSQAFEVEGLCVAVQVTDARNLTADSIWNAQIRGRIAEHPDALFAWLDADRNGRLSSREVHAIEDKILDQMADADGLRPDDFPDAIVIQLIRGDPSQDEAQFRLRAAGASSQDERPTWAKAMDGNHDGDISPIEFVGPLDDFRRMDIDGDGFLSGEEVLTTSTNDSGSDQ